MVHAILGVSPRPLPLAEHQLFELVAQDRWMLSNPDQGLQGVFADKSRFACAGELAVQVPQDGWVIDRVAVFEKAPGLTSAL